MEIKKRESKPIKTLDELIDEIKMKNIIVEEVEKTKELLKRINYQRLMVYRLKFLDESKKKCREGTTIEQIYRLYKFDRDLKFLVYEVMESFELMLRTTIAYTMGLKYGNHCYSDGSKFQKLYYHQKFMEKISEKIKREQDKKYKHKMVDHHHENYNDDLPIYKMIELTTFGQLSKFYSNLLDDDKKKIAENFKKYEFKINYSYISSWLIRLTEIRNICAHHDVLWNRKFELKSIRRPCWKESVYKKIGEGKEIYSIFGIFLIFKSIIIEDEMYNNFVQKLKILLKDYSDIVMLKELFFPEEWQSILNRKEI